MRTKPCLIFYFATLLKCTIGDTKVWLHNTDISLPTNRFNNTGNCDGLRFSRVNTGDIFIKNLEVKKIILPIYGTITLMSDSVIKFDINDNEMNCMHLQPIKMAYWHMPEAWSNLDNPYNSAIPLTEKLPCWYDDVEFPNSYNSSIDTMSDITEVHKVKIGSKSITNSEEYHLYREAFPGRGFKQIDLSILSRKTCIYSSGCICHSENVCDLMDYQTKPIQCTDPVVPIGNCGEPMCGSILKIRDYGKDFTIKKIKDALKNYKSDTFVSKVRENNKNVIQITMSEEQFNGQSLLDAPMFYKVLTSDPSLSVTKVDIFMSGAPITQLTRQIHDTLSVVFGSLLVALLLIGVLFLFSAKQFDKFNFRIINVSTRPTFMFARYEHMPDRGDGESMAGSIISLNRSFDNPMYEDTAPVRRISNETIISKVEELEEDSEVIEDKPEKLETVTEGTESAVDTVQTVPEEQTYDDVLLKDL